MARQVNRFNALHKKQSQIDAYMEKIREIEQQKKDLENEFALQVGQLILKKLKNDIEDVETFSEWLELYLLEQEEKATENDSVASEDVTDSDSDTNV
jgi:predicted nuclease with TOPRIM domain